MIGGLIALLPLSQIFVGMRLLENDLHDLEIEEDSEDISNVPFEMN